ncbi:type II toxin-antitoxin system RnlB family antitoxin [Cytobacillus spongiae]|uniref:type II toxin-antitoxin system RnlB family antitoxin n=1 Tax=Cytobacillus spongiae TaxID=2901381 RepID=UPI001F29A1E2|nr:type II toxin-antitoxin system RnlB family antitoxin [Cytobacillus spongiae]UII56249.1 type II toxin-antitoxin system RnlB family antitoxin [Cytobacillus spongiae]
MGNFDIVSINTEEYKCIIFSTSFETPLAHLNEINQKLLNHNLNDCKIVFDMLTHIGNNSDRFVEASYDGNKLNIDTFKHIQISKKHELRKTACNYFKDNLNILDYSILSSFQKKMIEKGIAI